jgi:LPXTG-motif cell wall-anchored protein
MKKRVLAGILMMILVLASAMTVSAAGSKEQGSKEAGVRVVTPADKFEAKATTEAEPSVDAVKDLTNVAKFELAKKAGVTATLPADITLEVDALGDKVEKVVLVVKDGNNWKTVDAKLNGKQITANFAAEGPVFVYVKTASSAGGQSPSTGVTSSAWMIMLAVAVMAVGAGVVATQKKSR